MNLSYYCMRGNKMKQSYLINGKRVVNKTQLHDYLIQVFMLPEYYGRNLDALWDCLSTDSAMKKITIIHTESLVNALGDYSKSLIQLFDDLSKKRSIEIHLHTKGRKNETN